MSSNVIRLMNVVSSNHLWKGQATQWQTKFTLCEARQEKTRWFRTQLLQYFPKRDDKNYHHLQTLARGVKKILSYIIDMGVLVCTITHTHKHTYIHTITLSLTHTQINDAQIRKPRSNLGCNLMKFQESTFWISST